MFTRVKIWWHTMMLKSDSCFSVIATKALGQLGDAGSVGPLIEALGYRDWGVRSGAAGALGQLGDVRAVEPLIMALEDETVSTNSAVAKALGQLGDIRAVEPLIRELKKGGRDYFDGGVAKALGQLGDVRAVEPLVRALEYSRDPVHSAAVAALEELAKKQPACLERIRAMQFSPLPAFEEVLRGTKPVRVCNPNEVAVATGIRLGTKGQNFAVPANGVETVYVPNGKYDIFFVYSDKPDALFQGDAFTLNNKGVEIQFVKVVDGNYSIRQVK